VLSRARWAIGAGRVFELAQGFAALPVSFVVYDALRDYVGCGALPRRPRAKRAYFEGAWRYEGPLLDAFGAWLSADGALAYVETEYFGGAGDQGACAWRAGARVYGPRRGSEGVINEALAQIGVKSGPGDEFEAIGLAARRSNDDFVSGRDPPAVLGARPARGGPVPGPAARPVGPSIRRRGGQRS
jgi:hypothetical protein